MDGSQAEPIDVMITIRVHNIALFEKRDVYFKLEWTPECRPTFVKFFLFLLVLLHSCRGRHVL